MYYIHIHVCTVCVISCSFLFVHYSYTGGRTADDIINYINSKSGEWCVYSNCEQLVSALLSFAYDVLNLE